MLEIAGVSGHVVVVGQNLMAFGNQPVAQVRADEARGSGHNESQSLDPQLIYRSVGRASL